MAYSLKKVWAAMSLTLVAATSLVGAANFDGGYNNGCPCPCPQDACCSDFYFVADALIFKACEDGLTYGTERFRFFPGSESFYKNKVKNVHPKWHTGFRLGLGWNRPCECLDAVIYWTHYQSHAHSDFFREDFEGVDTFFYPAWGVNNDDSAWTEDAVDFADARWKLKLDLLDIEVGRSFAVCPCIVFRPFIGVRAGWIKQSFNIEYGEETSDDVFERTLVHLKQRFDGAGLRAGFDSEWEIGCGCSLYGQLAASLLWGNHDNEFEEITGNFDAPEFYDQEDDHCFCQAITDLALGFQWKSCWCNDCVNLTAHIGWEQHHFFNKNRFEDWVSQSNDHTRPQYDHGGPLCLNGVVIGAKLDF